MSSAAVEKVYALAIKDRAALDVLLNLAHRLNKDTGRCNPSRGKIVRDTRLNRATVLRKLKELEALGFIKIIPPAQGDRYGTNSYVLKLDKSDGQGAHRAPSQGAQPTPPKQREQHGQGAQPRSVRGRSHVDSGGAPCAPKERGKEILKGRPPVPPSRGGCAKTQKSRRESRPEREQRKMAEYVASLEAKFDEGKRQPETILPSSVDPPSLRCDGGSADRPLGWKPPTFGAEFHKNGPTISREQAAANAAMIRLDAALVAAGKEFYSLVIDRDDIYAAAVSVEIAHPGAGLQQCIAMLDDDLPFKSAICGDAPGRKWVEPEITWVLQ